MATLPERAKVVVIGAGIVGNSMAWHLAKQGWKDILLIEKGTLPNPGGSTGHASNFIFLTDHSKEMAAFTLDSANQYRDLGVYHECGGIEVARTPERLEELKRRIASSTSWGVEGARLLTPAEVKAMVPFIDETVILRGFYTPPLRLLAAGGCGGPPPPDPGRGQGDGPVHRRDRHPRRLLHARRRDRRFPPGP